MAFVLFQQGQLGRAVPLGELSTRQADEAGLIASSITLRSELAWMYAFCGAFDEAYALISRAMQFAESRQPAWRSFPQAAWTRVHLLQGDMESAQRAAGDGPLQPTSIPYARFTIFVVLANIELAYAKGEFATALKLVDELLEEVEPQTRLDVPEVLRWKGRILLKLGRIYEAFHFLTEACSRAGGMGAVLQLWLSYADLADVLEKLGKREEAESKREEARKIIGQISESLRAVGLRDSFLNQPRVVELMR